MTNNDNDDLTPEGLDAGGLDDADGFDDFEGGSNSNVMSNPMVKVGIVVAAVATIIGGIVLFGGKEEKKVMSQIRGARDVTAVPGMEAVSPEMEKALVQVNEETAEQAARTGGSAMPVPITPPEAKLGLPDLDGGDEEDPLERWRKIQEERQKREALQGKANAPQGDPNAPIVEKLAKSMSQQMQTILDSQAIQPSHVEIVTTESWLEKKKLAQEEKVAKARAEAEASRKVTASRVLDIIQPAGTIEYAQLITEANSDVPGPVLAQIMSGPLRGARLLGSFKAQEEHLVLNFKTVVVDGVSYSADAIALDPSSAHPGVVTEIDQRYFKRVILPAAAAFVEGMGKAIAESGSTSVSVSGETVVQSENELDTRQEALKGVEEAADKVGEFLDKEASTTKRLVKVHAGTAVGILFLSPVTKAPNKT